MAMQKNLVGLEKIIGITFKDKTLAEVALTHRSHINENKEQTIHNERLEFLGDAVLELVVTEYLYAEMPETPEGKMTSIRAALVRKENLHKVALDIKLGEYIFLSRGEDAGGGRNNAYILANTVEAVIGALYLDQGYEIAKGFIRKFVIAHLDEIMDKQLYRDSKSRLQEVSQEKLRVTPTYKIVDESGPDHNKVFESAVYFDEEIQGRGTGKSKQAAEIQAARNALENLGW